MTLGKKKIDSFFKRKAPQSDNDTSHVDSSQEVKTGTQIDSDHAHNESSRINFPQEDNRRIKAPRIELEEFDASSLVRDLGLRKAI